MLFGWQHTLVDISPFVLPLAVAAALGMTPAESASLVSFGLVAMGLATLLQTTLGNRLPIVQGPSATLVGTLAPVAAQVGAPAMWAGIVLGGILEAIAGALGLPGMLRRWLPPAVTGTVIIVIGLSLGRLAVSLAVGDGSGIHFVLAGSVIGLVLFFNTALRRVAGGLLAQASIFLAIWIVGLGLGSALQMVDWQLVASRPWFELPRLFPYGGPGGGPGGGWQLSFAAAVVILVGYLGSAVESLGDYAATCEVSGVDYTERHMNRGIFAEGVGSVLAAVIGGLPCTSYTQNIGIIATTRIASRFVVQMAATILIVYGLCPKFGALLVALPRSVLGGVFVLVCGMILMSGVGLVHAGVRSSKTGSHQGFVVGVTLILALGLPNYAAQTLGPEWLETLPQVLRLIVTNPVVLAVLLGIGLNLVVRSLGSISSRQETPF